MLSDALGLDDLELVSTGWRVETFSLDILARGADADGDVTVVIENQYGRTDHRQLGQLLTYAAVGGRVLAVWLTEDVRPAHAAAIEFLNRISASEDAAFGVVLLRVRFTPSPDAFYVYFESEAQPNLFISTTPQAARSLTEVAEQGNFIEAVVRLMDPKLQGAGLVRAGQVDWRHGIVRYRLPSSFELSRLVTVWVICTKSYTNVAILIEAARPRRRTGK